MAFWFFLGTLNVGLVMVYASQDLVGLASGFGVLAVVDFGLAVASK